MIEIEALVGRQKARGAQMPFADARGRVLCVVEALGEGLFRKRQLLFDDRMKKFLRRTVRAARQISRQMQTGRGFAGQDRRARRRANGLRDIGASEARTLGGQAVEVRGVMFAPAVTGEVVRTEIIGENEDDVRARRRSRWEYRQRGEQPDCDYKQLSCHGLARFRGAASTGFPAPSPVT